MPKSSSKEGSSGLCTLVRQDFDICVSGGVINANMNILVSNAPLAASTTRARIPINAVSRSAHDPRQTFDVDMHQLPRTLPLVPVGWRRRSVKVSPSRQTGESKNATDSRSAESEFGRNLSAWLPFDPKGDHLLSHSRTRPSWRVSRSRGAINQGVHAALLPARQPLIARALTDTRSRTCFVHRPALDPDSMNEKDSTPEAGSRILVNVHLGSLSASVGLSTIRFAESRPDGQPPLLNNVLKDHS